MNLPKLANHFGFIQHSPTGQPAAECALFEIFHEKAKQKYFGLVVLLVAIIKTKKEIPFTPTYSVQKLFLGLPRPNNKTMIHIRD